MISLQGSSPTKKPFAPSTSITDGNPFPTPRQTFDRTDSRGSYQCEAAPDLQTRAALQSVGMRARAAVGKGYEVINPPFTNISLSNANNNSINSNSNSNTGTAHPGSLATSSRATWSRVQSAPTWTGSGSTIKELQPFSESTVEVPHLPYQSFLQLADRNTASTTLMEEDEDGMSFTGSSSSSGTKRRATDDVLGDFMSDDEDEDQVGGGIGQGEDDTMKMAAPVEQ